MRSALSIVAVSACVLSASAPAAAAAEPAGTKAEAPPQPKSQATKVNVNSATAPELGALKGIDAERALAIIENRCYKAASDLFEKKIIPKSVYDRIKDQLVVSEPCVRREPVAAGGDKKDAK